ncbi:MAG: glycoside hydrolase family 3 C-terminal domain-containing protein, partial [Gemmatimonadaceae bacterium]
FNDIGGTPAHASDWLLRTVLRERWGFGGIVVSDWAGIEQLTAHGVAASLGDAGIRALRAGVDVDMADGVYTDSLAAAVRAGRLAESVIDTAVTRVLRTKFALGLFRDPYRGVTVERERAATLTPAHIAAARESARRAIVLLANANGTLPLPKTLRSLAVIGPLADDARSMLGNWAAIGRPEDAVTVLAGIRRAVEPGTRVLYARGAPVDTASTAGFADAVRIAREADAVILVLGEREDMSAEAASRASLELAGAQLGLAQAVVRAARASRAGASKPVVAVLVNGRPLATPWLADSVPALLETWLLGVQHGVAVADVLFGDANPGGKLPVSVPRATGQVPIYYNHRNTGRPPEAAEKYTSKYADLPWTPLYPFGHGLSYTTFAYRDLHLSSPTMRATDSLRVSVTVTNSGRRAGDEVVQLYLRDDVASVARPVKELRRFERITLEPGESRTVRWTLGPDDLAFYDGALRRIVEPGTFTLYAGTSSADESHLARFTVTGDTLVLAAPPPRFR